MSKSKTDTARAHIRPWYEAARLIAGIDGDPNLKYLLTLVHGHTNHAKGYAWASQETLAEEMGVSLSTFERAWREAKSRGLVGVRRIREKTDKQYNHYWLDFARLKQSQAKREHPSPVKDAPTSEHPSKQPRAPFTGERSTRQNDPKAPFTSEGEGSDLGFDLGSNEVTSAPSAQTPAPQDNRDPKHPGQAATDATSELLHGQIRERIAKAKAKQWRPDPEEVRKAAIGLPKATIISD